MSSINGLGGGGGGGGGGNVCVCVCVCVSAELPKVYRACYVLHSPWLCSIFTQLHPSSHSVNAFINFQPFQCQRDKNDEADRSFRTCLCYVHTSLQRSC